MQNRSIVELEIDSLSIEIITRLAGSGFVLFVEQ